jgi:hypothetical protein
MELPPLAVYEISTQAPFRHLSGFSIKAWTIAAKRRLSPNFVIVISFDVKEAAMSATLASRAVIAGTRRKAVGKAAAMPIPANRRTCRQHRRPE